MTISTSPRPGRALDPAKRAAILEGARAVFMREGFAQGSMDAVAAEAGVGKQTIYRHFRSKEALVEALVEAMCAPEVVRPPPRLLPAGQRLRELLLTFVAGVTRPDSVRLYRAIVAEAERMPGLGRLFWEAGPRQVRIAIAQLWAEEHKAATAPVVAEQLVQLALGDAYQELVLGTGSPRPEVFEHQIDAALALWE
ncbi:TetR/AcrR family transcriptional regulator [Mesorhizobium sp. 8]|uniref:TetR/AcrR family transcriptional regulator n=1 Tax=Mesorhizobium sp. 8 TaxID=2584466 RepID=UPI0011205033|nr:TetR/AcrR family transcriptional regulator [Mesorhizobium sp. 8]QDB99457.1 TetR/AcrR family transcriptional regulator [Mesorhizobium sp. 8]